jgi:hypothetical protein
MVLSKQEIMLLQALRSVDGPMPVDWLKPAYRGAERRMRDMGLLYKRDPEFVQLTKLGRTIDLPQGIRT